MEIGKKLSVDLGRLTQTIELAVKDFQNKHPDFDLELYIKPIQPPPIFKVFAKDTTNGKLIQLNS